MKNLCHETCVTGCSYPCCQKGNWNAKKATGKLCLRFSLSLVKLQACSLTSAPFSPGHGSIPYENSSSTVIPKAHTSEAWENLRNLRTSCGHLKRSTHTCYNLGISYLQVHNKCLKQAA